MMMLVDDIGICGDRSFSTLKVVATAMIMVVVSVTMLFRCRVRWATVVEDRV